jgi:hypothetical protein
MHSAVPGFDRLAILSELAIGSKGDFMHFVRFILLLLVVGSVTGGLLPLSAQSKAPVPRQKTITDAAGRVHVRRAFRSTHAERKAVAKRQAKARQAKAAQKRQVTR